MRHGRARFSCERGAVLVQVVVLSIVLVGFWAMLIDYGIMHVARAQAQNMADAGALAGATTLAFDASFVLDPSSALLATDHASKAASKGSVWGQAPLVNVRLCRETDSFSDDCRPPQGFPTPADRQWFSTTVEVFLNGEYGSGVLPTYFAQLFGVSSQGVRATATAAVAPANTARCVWPLAIADRFEKKNAQAPPSTPEPNTFWNRTYAPEQAPGGMPDDYTRVPRVGSEDEHIDENYPNQFQLQDGYRLLAPNVTDLTLEGLVAPGPGGVWPRIDYTHAVAVQIGGGFDASLGACSEQPIHIGDVLSVAAGASFSSVTTAATARVGQDPGASWNVPKATESEPNPTVPDYGYRIRKSCASQNPPCALMSPRLVVLPVFDTDLYDQTRGATPTIEVVNFVGLFIDTVGGQLDGHLTIYPGTVDYAYPLVHYRYSLLRTVLLTR